MAGQLKFVIGGISSYGLKVTKNYSYEENEEQNFFIFNHSGILAD